MDNEVQQSQSKKPMNFEPNVIKTLLDFGYIVAIQVCVFHKRFWRKKNFYCHKEQIQYTSILQS